MKQITLHFFPFPWWRVYARYKILTIKNVPAAAVAFAVYILEKLKNKQRHTQKNELLEAATANVLSLAEFCK